MGTKASVASVLAVSMLVSGCATQGQGSSQNQTAGAVAGTALGAGLGFLIPYGGGTLLSVAGGLVGSRIGAYLDEKEKREMADASVRAAAEAKTGERVDWGEPNPRVPPSPGAQGNSGEEPNSNAQPSPSVVSTSSAEPKPPATENSSAKTIVSKVKPTSSPGAQTAARSQTKMASADANASGWVAPLTDVYVTAKGQKCRDLQQVVNKDGKTYQQKVQACQSGPDWIIPQA